MAETKTAKLDAMKIQTVSLREKLMRIQVELKAPKNLYNSFGKYKYRNAEGIQEALKPLENEYYVTTVLNDEIVDVAGRIYVKATAKIMDCASDDVIEVTAYAREADAKKGMDEAQVTGATSSYARKYALNALFLLDDTKDVDSEEYQEQSKAKTSSKANETTEQAHQKAKEAYEALIKYCKEHDHDINAVAKDYSLNSKSKAEDFELAMRKLIYFDNKEK